jgi:DNA-binding SARP family transcriptional activator
MADEEASRTGLRIGVLGPIQVWSQDGTVVRLGRRQTVAVAVLAAELGHTVSADRLVDALWPDSLPLDPRAALRNVVSRLRLLLGGGSDAFVNEGKGYRLRWHRDVVDAFRFDELVVRSGEVDGAERIGVLDEALALWRGDAYAECAEVQCLQPERFRLEEQRSLAREHRARAFLELGRSEDALLDLEALVRAEVVPVVVEVEVAVPRSRPAFW